MPTFAHDPRRLHPPYVPSKDAGGVPQPLPPEDDSTASPDGPSPVAEEPPRTRRVYLEGPVLVSVALGGSGEPHRLVWVGTQRLYRLQGLARAKMAEVMADLDADGMECVVAINNVEPDVDVLRMSGFFESFGFSVEATDPYPQLRRLPTQPAPSTS